MAVSCEHVAVATSHRDTVSRMAVRGTCNTVPRVAAFGKQQAAICQCCHCLSSQAYGGGGGATSVDFDLKGQAWEWGDYGLDQVSCVLERTTK